MKSEIRSTGITVSRNDAAAETSAHMASLAGVDGTFIMPTCLLPHHSHLVPPEPSTEDLARAEKQDQDDTTKRPSLNHANQGSDKNEPLLDNTEKTKTANQEPESEQPKEGSPDPDTIPISVSIRATLPARFDESLLSFAASLSKAAQMLDINEHFVDPPTPPPIDSTSDPNDSFREKWAKKSSRMGSAIKHPWQSAQGRFHREMRKTGVMSMNGAWFAKWINKILEQMEWLNGDVGYTFEVPISLKPYR